MIDPQDEDYQRRKASVMNKLYQLQYDGEAGITTAELRSNMRMDKEEFIHLIETLEEYEGLIEVLPKPLGNTGRGRPSDLLCSPKILRGPESTREKMDANFVPQPTEDDNPLYLIEKQRRVGKVQFSLSGTDAVMAVMDRIVKFGTKPFTKDKLMQSMNVLIPNYVYDLVWDRFTTPFCEETFLGNGFEFDGEKLRHVKKSEVYRDTNILNSGQLAAKKAFTDRMSSGRNPYLISSITDEADYERIKSNLAEAAKRVGPVEAVLSHPKLPRVVGNPAERQRVAEEYGDGRNPESYLFPIFDLYQHTPDPEHKEIMEIVMDGEISLENKLEEYKNRAIGEDE